MRRFCASHVSIPVPTLCQSLCRIVRRSSPSRFRARSMWHIMRRFCADHVSVPVPTPCQACAKLCDDRVRAGCVPESVPDYAPILCHARVDYADFVPDSAPRIGTESAERNRHRVGAAATHHEHRHGKKVMRTLEQNRHTQHRNQPQYARIMAHSLAQAQIRHIIDTELHSIGHIVCRSAVTYPGA